jgi:ABC-2 type transport system ATP-binding protein
MTLLAPYGLSALTVEPPSLESLFLRLYEADEDPR